MSGQGNSGFVGGRNDAANDCQSVVYESVECFVPSTNHVRAVERFQFHRPGSKGIRERGASSATVATCRRPSQRAARNPRGPCVDVDVDDQWSISSLVSIRTGFERSSIHFYGPKITTVNVIRNRITAQVGDLEDWPVTKREIYAPGVLTSSIRTPWRKLCKTELLPDEDSGPGSSQPALWSVSSHLARHLPKPQQHQLRSRVLLPSVQVTTRPIQIRRLLATSH